MFEPHFEVLPDAQRKLWDELAEVPKPFVLYGGTALALRLGHRQSLDFDFFAGATFVPEELLLDLKLLRGARILQNSGQTLTVTVDRGQIVKLSFFGGISIGRVGTPEETPDGVLRLASLLDLAGTKAKTVLQRAESKDYRDLLALFARGITLSQAMSAAKALYGQQYNPALTIKSLTYFGDGDLHTLAESEKRQLALIAAEQRFQLPPMERLSDDLSLP